MEPTRAEIIGLIVAILGGAAVGVERQHSGHAQTRCGGLRTFTLLGSLAGIAGLLIGWMMPIPAAMLLAGAGALTLF